jgi:NAD+ synthase (glutamine-hydrolysing)
MKIALLQCNSVTGDIAGNLQHILHAAEEAAKAGAELCVTPELALCGVAPGRYLCAEDFATGCLRALNDMAEKLKDGPPLLVGTPVPSAYASGLLSNAAVFVQNGLWRVISRKVYHDPALRHNLYAPYHEDDGLFDRGVSCGILPLHGWRLGVVLCEEGLEQDSSFWQARHASGHNPLMELIQRGVDAVIHLGATPFRAGVQASFEYMLSHAAARHHVHIFSANMVGGNDSRVYHGQSLVIDPTGQLLARGKAFEEDILVLNASSAQHEADPLPALASDEESYWNALVLGTRDFVHKCGLEKALVALSGGMDSALVCCVAAAALGAQNVTAILMPAPHSSPDSLSDARRLASNLGIESITIPIKSLMQTFAETLEAGLAIFEEKAGDTTFENIQARIRGCLVTLLANRARALVLNTNNKSERAVGYSTLYGDTVGALSVIGDLTKSQVYAVGRWYNQARGKEVIPEAIFRKAPSAELRPGQKDADSLPPYPELDPLLESLLLPPRFGTPPMTEQRQEIRQKIFGTEFKRRQEPLALYVSPMPFGNAWQVPVAGKYILPEDNG